MHEGDGDLRQPERRVPEHLVEPPSRSRGRRPRANRHLRRHVGGRASRRERQRRVVRVGGRVRGAVRRWRLRSVLVERDGARGVEADAQLGGAPVEQQQREEQHGDEQRGAEAEVDRAPALARKVRLHVVFGAHRRQRPFRQTVARVPVVVQFVVWVARPRIIDGGAGTGWARGGGGDDGGHDDHTEHASRALRRHLHAVELLAPPLLQLRRGERVEHAGPRHLQQRPH